MLCTWYVAVFLFHNFWLFDDDSYFARVFEINRINFAVMCMAWVFLCCATVRYDDVAAGAYDGRRMFYCKCLLYVDAYSYICVVYGIAGTCLQIYISGISANRTKA